MGVIPLSIIINLYITTPGRRVYALREVKRRARKRGLSDLVTRIDRALAHEARTAELEGLWSAGRTGKRPVPRDFKPRIDRTLLVIAQMLTDCAKDPDPEIARYAAELANQLFPQTVTEHIRLPYVDQLQANEYVLTVLEATERKDWVDLLGLRIYARRLRTLNDGFRQALLARDAEPAVKFDEVRAAREQAQENYIAVAARIGGLYCDREDGEIRTDLLACFIEQNDALRAYRRRRRRPVDINADTGEPLDPLPDDTGDDSTDDSTDDSAEPAEPAAGDEPADE
jgi:hypothetical protein